VFETSADTKARERRERRRRRQQGLIGLLGHTFTEQDGARRIQTVEPREKLDDIAIGRDPKNLRVPLS